MTRRIVMLLLGLLVLAPVVRAQDQPDQQPDQPQPRAIPLPDRFRQGVPHGAVMDMRRRLLELDRLLSLGSLGRAEAIIKDKKLKVCIALSNYTLQ